MGLDAVVYKRLEEISLAPGTDLSTLRVEDTTGEVYFENDAVILSSGDREAVHKRLGNITAIMWVRDEIEKLLPSLRRNSILLRKVVYDGTHSGDFIPVEDLPALKRELSVVRQRVTPNRVSDLLHEFLDSMDELIAAAEQQGNPIVFT